MKQRIRNYQIEASDDRNYTVDRVGISKDGANKGKETLTNVGYFNSIESAVDRIAKLCGNECDDLKAWLAEYRAVKDEVMSILDES